MEAFEEYLEVKQVGKISLCQILSCFLNTHQGKAIKQPIACIFCQEQHYLSLSLTFPLLLPPNEQDQDQENCIKSLKHVSSLQEYHIRGSHHHIHKVPLVASVAATTEEEPQDFGGRQGDRESGSQ